MSNSVFPVVRGLGWSVRRMMTFPGVTVKESRNTKRSTAIYQTAPVWRFELTYEYLNDILPNGANPYTDKKMIEGFYALAGGAWDTWLYQDPEDNTYTAQTMIGIIDGVNTAFQVGRMWGGYNEPIQNIDAGTLIVKKNDWQGNQLQYLTPRTNLLSRSADFTNASWQKTNANITATGDTTLAPDGTTSADTLTDNDAVTDVVLLQTFTVPNDSASYTGSIFLKAGTSPVVAIRLSLTVGGTPVSATVAFNPSNGQFSASSLGAAPATVTVVAYPNGWYKVSFSVNNNSTGNTTLGMSIRPYSAAALAGNGLGFTTTNVISGTGTVIAWGAQIELGLQATSYIPSLATSVTVTDYSVNGVGRITFTTAPLAGSLVTADFSFKFRCCFVDDNLDVEEFAYQLWTLNSVKFRSVIL